MLTKLGKFLRILRMERGELLKDMADKLTMAPSYLSSIENGKRTPARDFIQKFETQYSLTESEKEELQSAFEQTLQEVTINLQNLKNEYVDLSIVFARKLDELSDEQVKAINKILGIGREKTNE